VLDEAVGVDDVVAPGVAEALVVRVDPLRKHHSRWEQSQYVNEQVTV